MTNASSCPDTRSSRVGVVMIGRNEGRRLISCIQSVMIQCSGPVIYVDSGSTDGSIQNAADEGVCVIELDPKLPFTAARARNEGFLRLQEMAPDLRYVQFVDGDCTIADNWIASAASFLENNTDVGLVCGRRRERYPKQSVYNGLCDNEWNTPVGRATACGGDVLMRTDAFDSVGGYRPDMIAGEEPELCVRLRAKGWSIWRIDCEMTLHDAAMYKFRQWWQRSVRNGYAFALGAHLHGAPPERHWVWESRRALLWGLLLPLSCAGVVAVFGYPGLILALIYPVQIARQLIRNTGSIKERVILATFQVLSRFPEALGQLKFIFNKTIGAQGRLIEYK
jgi:glycosyltransferase involved in cell wall biosynthesis